MGRLHAACHTGYRRYFLRDTTQAAEGSQCSRENLPAEYAILDEPPASTPPGEDRLRCVALDCKYAKLPTVAFVYRLSDRGFPDRADRGPDQGQNCREIGRSAREDGCQIG